MQIGRADRSPGLMPELAEVRPRRSRPPIGPMKTSPSSPACAKHSRCQRSSGTISRAKATVRAPACDFGSPSMSVPSSSSAVERTTRTNAGVKAAPPGRARRDRRSRWLTAARAGTARGPSSPASIVQLAAVASRAPCGCRQGDRRSRPLTRRPLARDRRLRGRWGRPGHRLSCGCRRSQAHTMDAGTSRAQMLARARARSAMARRATSASGTKRSKPCGAPGWTWSSMGTPALARPRA